MEEFEGNKHRRWYRDLILDGREISGEPRDFNF
jgi:hypothetical protein